MLESDIAVVLGTAVRKQWFEPGISQARFAIQAASHRTSISDEELNFKIKLAGFPNLSDIPPAADLRWLLQNPLAGDSG